MSSYISSLLIISPFPSTCALIMFGFIGYATLSYGRSVPALCEQKGAHSSIERTYYMTVEQDPGAAALFEKFGTYILPGRVNDPRRGIEDAEVISEQRRVGKECGSTCRCGWSAEH